MVEFELRYFHRVPASASTTLLRLGGQWDGARERSGPAELLLLNGGETHRVAQLPGSGGRDGRPMWQAAFAAPAELVRHGTEFRLDAGGVIPLPAPTEREDPGPEPERPPAAAEPILVTPPAGEEPARPSRRALWAVLALLGLGLVVAFAAGAFSSSSQTKENATAPVAASSPPVQLAPLPGLAAGPAGTASVRGSQVTLRLRGLGPGVFQAWLYETVIGARPLSGPFRGPAANVTVTLPASTAGFHFLDISREGDPNPNHSGESVLRIPLAGLRR